MRRDQPLLGFTRPIRILPPGRLTPTSAVDAVAHYHGLGYGAVLRRRLKWVCDALPTRPLHRVLDIGYGSGIFFPELTSRATAVFGIDMHPHGARTKRELSDCGVEATLAQGDAMALPFRDDTFDAVVCVSTLEFVPDPAQVLTEAYRVTRPGGVVLGVTPRPLAWADRVYSALVGFDPEADFRGGRTKVQRALETLGLPLERQPRPRGLPRGLVPYELLVIKRPVSHGGGVRAPRSSEIPVSISRSTEPSSKAVRR